MERGRLKTRAIRWRRPRTTGEQLENTQREDWLLPTERQTGVEHPAATEDSVFGEAADLPSPSDIGMGPSVCRQEVGLI